MRKRGFTPLEISRSKRLLPCHGQSRSLTGFTLIELLIVVGITAILVGIGSSNYFGERNKRNLDITTDLMVRELNSTRSRAIAQEGGYQWWMRFDNPAGNGNDLYQICYGTSYTALGASCAAEGVGAGEAKRYPLGSGLDLTVPASGVTRNVVFEKSTGNLPKITGTVTATNGSTTISGSGTSFLSQFLAGEYIMVNGVATQIATVNSNTLITLSSAFTGTGGSGLLPYKQVRVIITSRFGSGSRVIAISNNGTIDYSSISAGAPAPTVTSINPISDDNGSSASITSIGGTNFVSGVTVSLTKSGQTTISCTGFTFTSSTTLSNGSCPITGAALGTWNVVATNPDMQAGTLSNGFTVTTSIAWYGPSWLYRIKLTASNTKVDANLTDFPVYVDLSNLPAGTFWTNVKASCADVRVTTTDAITEVPREIVSCNNGARTGEMYFKAPALADVTNTDFYIYYGNAAATEPAANATYGSQNTWNPAYKFVYHAGTNPTLGLTDSTSNLNNITNGGLTSGVGQTGGAFVGNGTDQSGSITSNAGLNSFTQMSVETWVNVTGYSPNTDGVVFVTKNVSNSTATDPYELYALFVDSTGKVYWRVSNGIAGTFPTVASGAGYLSTSTWTWLAGTYDANTLRLYKNGSQFGTTTATTITVGNNTTPLTIGDFGPAGYNYHLKGSMDEIRLSNIARAGTWISTEYNDQSSPSTFYSLAAQENAP